MDCPRCDGLMARDNCMDLKDEAGQCWFVAWHCLICGEVLDPVILKNRSASLESQIDRRHLRPKMQFVTTGKHRARKSNRRSELVDDPGGGVPSAGVPGLGNLADFSLFDLGDDSV